MAKNNEGKPITSHGATEQGGKTLLALDDSGATTVTGAMSVDDNTSLGDFSRLGDFSHPGHEYVECEENAFTKAKLDSIVEVTEDTNAKQGQLLVQADLLGKTQTKEFENLSRQSQSQNTKTHGQNELILQNQEDFTERYDFGLNTIASMFDTASRERASSTRVLRNGIANVNDNVTGLRDESKESFERLETNNTDRHDQSMAHTTAGNQLILARLDELDTKISAKMDQSNASLGRMEVRQREKDEKKGRSKLDFLYTKSRKK